MTLQFKKSLEIPELGKENLLHFMKTCKEILDMEPKFATIIYSLPRVGEVRGRCEGEKIDKILITFVVRDKKELVEVNREGAFVNGSLEITWEKYKLCMALFAMGALY